MTNLSLRQIFKENYFANYSPGTREHNIKNAKKKRFNPETRYLGQGNLFVSIIYFFANQTNFHHYHLIKQAYYKRF